MSFQEDIINDLEKIKSLSEQALQTMKRSDSAIKYKLILSEMEEIKESMSRVTSHANIEIHLRYEEEKK